ncbi:MAG: twin-arginine translocase TatA/TatE family subunit [Deltaproteobacteria bacterium]|nr:twin-arginine translocase TatA/TatE family subunit [Deltaproteobacteria bacterium]
MFDISLGEFILIALIAMAFLGPEKIPVAARRVGEFIKMVKDAFTQVRDEVTKDEATAEAFNEMHRTVQDIANVVNVRRVVREMGQPLLEPSRPHKKSTSDNSDNPRLDTESTDQELSENFIPATPDTGDSENDDGFSDWSENLNLESVDPENQKKI